ncbi:MAG: alpha/beta fold hydrolase, partial [Saprospiraceae bacterium]
WYAYRDTVDADYARRCLYGAIALLAFISLGKFLLPRLFSKSRPNEDQPHAFDTNQRINIERPDGSTINVEYYGKEDAPPIVFVHGWNATIDEWYYQRKYFEKDYRIIMMDLPGLGKSTRPRNKDFSLSKMALDLQAVIEQSNAQNPILWGHSIGGMTILTLVAKHYDALKQPIRGIILEHTTYTNPVKTSMLSGLLTALQKPVLTPLCYLIIFLSPIMWLSRWMSYLNGNTHLMSRFLTFTGTQTYRQLNFISYLSTIAPPAVTARGVLGMFEYDVTPDLPNLQVPTLVLAADKDRLTKPEASAHMHQTMPNAQLVTVAPGGHQGLLERHAEVNAAAEQFIQSLTEVPGTTTLEEEDIINQQDRL